MPVTANTCSESRRGVAAPIHGGPGAGRESGGVGRRRVDSGALVMNATMIKGKLVSAEQLLEQLFAPECKPSLRWLRTQTKAMSIPHVRIGHLVFFDMELVRTALAGKNVARKQRMAVGKEVGG